MMEEWQTKFIRQGLIKYLNFLYEIILNSEDKDFW